MIIYMCIVYAHVHVNEHGVFPPLPPVLSSSREGFLIVAAIIVIISSLVRITFEIFQMFQLRVWKYFLDWVNWIELSLFTLSILFVFVFFTDCYCPRLAYLAQ